MRRLGDIKGEGAYGLVAGERYSCKFCGTSQVVAVEFIDLGAIEFLVRQCLHCSEPDIELKRYDGSYTAGNPLQLYPVSSQRPPVPFEYCKAEVREAYEDACLLFPVHSGAAGAYARRALEIILDNAGYPAKSLADFIKAAKGETDADKKLPKRLLQKLDYVKEIGNFALHVRRDDELAIVPISSEEVAACLEIVEEMISVLFDEPGKDYVRTVEANKKLRASGKKEIDLPPVPEGYVPPAEG